MMMSMMMLLLLLMMLIVNYTFLDLMYQHLLLNKHTNPMIRKLIEIIETEQRVNRNNDSAAINIVEVKCTRLLLWYYF